LRAKAVDALALYGDDTAILSEGRSFSSSFPMRPERMDVSLRMAEAYARQERVNDELAVYDRLLTELAAAADGVPLGPGTVQPLVFRPGPRPQGPRSPAYARTLDLAVSRLTGLGRLPAALALFAREIRRNPDDPGLYERLAGFLSTNGLGERVEAVYRQAMARFEDRSWEHRLGRFYLRSQKRSELESLTREAVDAFSGLEVEEYFRTVNPGAVDAQLYLQLNLYAHQRFPHNLTFVRNLLNAYRNPATSNPTAASELLRRHWFHADDLRVQYFGLLTRSGRLEPTLAAIESGSDAARRQRWAALARENPAAATLLAEGRAWRCRYEEAGPVFLAIATESPVDEPIASRAVDLSRSLASSSPILTDIAVALSESLANSQPTGRDQLAFTGDILADRGLYQRAAPYWRRMAETEPGRPENWLEAATVFWDYYLYDDALALLEEGRVRLGRRTLFSYEVGAIAEGRRDLDGAIREYLQGALSADQASAGRLAILSRRNGYREPIEQATARLTASASPSQEAIRLRLRVLDAGQRRDDAAALLLRLAVDANSYGALDLLEREATNRNLGAVRAAALERRIELTRDPVDRMRRRLELARLLESQGDSNGAERVSAAVHADNPRVLGVVRARVDYLWRSGRKPQAVETLVEAAHASYPELAKKFQLEAARKAIEAELYDRSHELLTALLADEPFQSQYLAATADSFARQDRNADLRTFHEGKLAELESSALSATEKRDAAALLRRGLIQALERLGDHAAAVDQHIELINRFPEDERLVEEAGLYALSHGQAERLEAAYVRTTETSPRNVQFHRVLAKLRMLFEDPPGALAAYENALRVRPDSVDLHQARAALLERQLLFEPALEAFEKLYELSYEEPRWMEKIGELHVRLGDAAAAESAVRKARIDGRPARPASFFDAARLLADWGLDEPAWRLAEEGVSLAGNRLFPEHLGGAALYARLATRLRRHDAAWARLRAATAGDEGLRWALRQPAEAILQTADELFSPEEKTALEPLLDRWRNQASPDELEQALLPALSATNLASVEARWRRQRLLAEPSGPSAADDRRRLIEIEQGRMRHEELGRALELSWQAHPARNQERQILDEAAAAFRAAGDFQAELRVLELRQGQGRWAERYLELLLEQSPERLIALAAGQNQALAYAAANYAALYGTAEQARRAVEAVGRRRQPVWTPAYTGLVGLFHRAADDAYAQAFLAALGDGTIGERVGRPVDRARQLAGDRWFEYGVRYGEYLGLTESAGAEDYLAAEVEADPGRAAAYSALAELYRAAGDSAAAEREYRHAVELAPREPSARLRLAEITLEAGRREEALGHWLAALERYAEHVEEFRLGPGFWDEVPATLATIERAGLTSELRAPIDRLIATYMRKSGAYRSGDLLEPFLLASADQPGEWERLLALAPLSDSPVQLLTALAALEWAHPQLRAAAARTAVAQAEAALAQAGPSERWFRLEAAYEARLALINLDMAAGRYADAWQRLRPADQELAARFLHEQAALVLTAGALSDATAEALDLIYPESYSSYYYGPAYGSDPLAEADQRLRALDSDAEADGLLEGRYQQQVDRRDLSASPLLGLAELRLRQGRTDDASALIDRLLRVSAEPFAHHLAAAELLLRHDARSEAAGLLDARVRAAPWDYRARLRLAQARGDEGVEQLRELALSPAVEYPLRAEAAADLRGRAGTGSLGSAELDYLAAGAGAADQPHFFQARVRAAEEASGAEKARLLAAALAERPGQASLPLCLAVLEAEIAAGRPTRALSAMQPLLAPHGLAYLLEQRDPAFAQDSYARRADSYMALQFLSDQGLSGAERARIAATVAGLLRSLGQLGSAETLLDLAQLIHPNDSTAEELRAVREQRRLLASNAARRPVIQEGLRQPHAVHPRQGGSR
jgi:cellulose synthase operon protein C